VPRFATVEDARVADVFRQHGWPRTLFVQLDRHQQRAFTGQFADVAFDAMQLRRLRVVDAEAFAGWHQPFAQLRVAGQIQIQAQRGFAAVPAPQAEQREQQARQHAVDHQHADQPGRPGLSCAFNIQCAVAAGADHFLGRHVEAEQRRQIAESLGDVDESVGAEDGGFPDKAVAPRGHQRQQQNQRAEHRQQPQTIDQRAERPAVEFFALQQQQQGRRQLRGFGVAGEFFAEPQPQAPKGGAVFASENQAQRPTQQQNQIDPEQTAQRPEDIHRRLAKCGESQAGAAEHGENHQQHQRQARALQPVLEGGGEPVTLGQP